MARPGPACAAGAGQSADGEGGVGCPCPVGRPAVHESFSRHRLARAGAGRLVSGEARGGTARPAAVIRPAADRGGFSETAQAGERPDTGHVVGRRDGTSSKATTYETWSERKQAECGVKHPINPIAFLLYGALGA